MKSERRKIKTPKSINREIVKHFLMLAVILVLLVESVFLIITSSSANSTAREQLMRIGRDVASLTDGHNDSALLRYMRNCREDGFAVYIVAPDGKVILPLEEAEEVGFSNEIEDIKSRLIKAGRGGSVIYTANDNLNYVASVNFYGEKILVASYSLLITRNTMRRLIIYFTIVGVIAITLCGLISYVVSQKLSGGLKNLSSCAERFSKGDFNVDFANSEYLELAALSDTLNSVRDEVKKSGDFQRELLANVSHDLKTPLTMIKAYASMIREISGNNPEKRDKHLQVIIDEADRLTGLVNDVLNVSKVNSTLNQINPKVFNLTEFVYGIINKFEYLQETQGYSFMVDIDANLYTRADEEKISQVIYKLLGNAVNYTGEEKTVYISLKKDLAGDRITLKIRDTGKGISKEDLPEIWNRYYRVNETHSRPVKGTGLGLNIVKIILQNHKFDFGVDSELGKGSTFWVDFPEVPAEIQ